MAITCGVRIKGSSSFTVLPKEGESSRDLADHRSWGLFQGLPGGTSCKIQAGSHSSARAPKPKKEASTAPFKGIYKGWF